jgi:ABC-2 type transport system ATP-binding protein
MDEAARCNRLLLMREGELVADTTPAELREETGEQELEAVFLHLVERSARPGRRRRRRLPRCEILQWELS